MNTYTRYEELRGQLAELFCRFVRASERFPGVQFAQLQADQSFGFKGWEVWIASNRQMDDRHESFDVYSASWNKNEIEIEEFMRLDGYASCYCGHFVDDDGKLDAALPELKRLCQQGIDLLFAIRQEVRKHSRLEHISSFSYLCRGYRGWLDSVRNTAELNRNVYLDVRTLISGVPDDLASEIRAIGRRMQEASVAKASGLAPAAGVNAFPVSPDIFSASANAIRLWLSGVVAENVSKPIHNFDPILIPSSSTDCDPAMGATSFGSKNLMISGNKKVTKRGRPRVSEETRKADCKIYDQYKASGESNYAEFAMRNGLREENVRRAVDTERKRRKRRDKKLER